MDISDLVKPTQKEEQKSKEIVSKFLDRLNNKLIAAEAIVGGSFAKDTWLKGDHDIDIYTIFSRRYDPAKISEILEKLLRKEFLFIKKINGSRDYFQIKFRGYLFEVIPVLKIDNPNEAENIMDISQMHVSWVKENINGLNSDVRKLKLFMKANNCYGAESYIRGFSGYVSEILVIYYGSFGNVLKNAILWREFEIVDTKNRKILIKNMDKSKISPLIVIDPVQKERNAAAALSKEKFDLFIKKAREYIKKPSIKFFSRTFVVPEDATVLKVKPLVGRTDVIGAKLLKAYEYIRDKLDEEFGISDSSWNWDGKAVFWYTTKTKELAEYTKHYGPPVEDETNLEKFKEKWEGYKLFMENDKVYINIKRKHTKLKPYLNYLVKNDDLKDKIKSIKIVRIK
ncbi:nucleotidyltransferase domain-containing protein [Candidatus Woesearchaeota archaeon]|nr:nucleotidyltransferase domain-containing protein [Candidatus Woesearchaeota archaeon]